MLRRMLLRPSRLHLVPPRVRLYSTPSKNDLTPSQPEKHKSNNEVEQAEGSGYVPKLTYERVSYEYPPPPKPKFTPDESKPWKRHIPALAAVLGIAWAMYAYKYFLSGDKSNSGDKLLKPDEFSKFKITYKQDISKDLQLIELSPSFEMYRNSVLKNEGIWNGKKLWSVDVKQPEIQVVRKYTPLPMYFMQGLGENPALLRLLGGKPDDDEGRMVLLVKKYDSGEVSKWLHRQPVGSTVEIRGPYVGHRFPYSPVDKTPQRQPMEDLTSRLSVEPAHPADLPPPENIAFFAAGTGIAPILQSLFSKNPPRGLVDVYYSVRTPEEIPFKRFILFLEKTGRARFHYFVDSENRFIGPKDVPAPGERQYLGYQNDKVAQELELKKVMDQVRRGEIVDLPSTNTDQVAAVSGSSTTTSVPAKTNSNETKEVVKYSNILEQAAAKAKIPQRPASLAVVCGPPGYVDYVAGKRDLSGRGPIGGLLGQKGWDETNVVRMES